MANTTMTRPTLITLAGACCVALVVPAFATEHGPWNSPAASVPSLVPRVGLAAAAAPQEATTKTHEPASCGEVPSYIAPQYYWQMRAILSLDCITELADQRLAATPGTGARAKEDVLT
jgi:hypothetical protein